MKTTYFKKILAPLILTPWAMIQVCLGQTTISPPNYTVTTPGGEFEFYLNNQNSGLPDADANVDDSLNFSLPAGATYVFRMSTASIHPVDICTQPNNTSYYSGASREAVTNGTVTVKIPAVNYPSNLYYICDIHEFYGVITITPPQAPPPITLLNVNLTSNAAALTFTGGTNTMPLTTQFSSNLTVWQTIPSFLIYSNSWGSNVNGTFSGTNISVFQRDPVDAVCGPNVFLRVIQVSR
jgi:hypothetical protein